MEVTTEMHHILVMLCIEDNRFWSGKFPLWRNRDYVFLSQLHDLHINDKFVNPRKLSWLH